MRETYATFNMGAGFAVYVDAEGRGAMPASWRRRQGTRAWVGGTVTKEGDRKAVEIVPLGITFEGDTLQVQVIWFQTLGKGWSRQRTHEK